VLIVQTPEKPTILYVKQSTNDPAFWGLIRSSESREVESIGLSGRRYHPQIEGERLAPVGLRVVVAATPCRGEAQRDGGAVVDA